MPTRTRASAQGSCPISLQRAQPEYNVGGKKKLYVLISAHAIHTHLAFSVKAFADGLKGDNTEALHPRGLLLGTGRQGNFWEGHFCFICFI